MLRQQTQILATRAYGELFDADRFRHEVLYTNGYRHVHPADLIKLQNGELLLMWREATEHIRGLMPVADRMVVLLDIDKLIAGQLPNTSDSEDQAPAAAAA